MATTTGTSTQSPQKVASGLSPRQVAGLLGRNQGPEFFFQQSWSTLGNVTIPKSVNLNRPLERFHMVWLGRIVLGTANMASTYVEGLANLVQNFKLNGTHNVFGALTPINMTGPDLWAWPSLFRARTSSIYITSAGVTTRVNPLSFPQGLALTVFGNLGTYDIEIHYDIVLIPVTPASSKLNNVPFLYLQQNWGDTLQIQLAFADQTALGPVGTTTFTFTSFGSASGTPQLYLFTNYEILGALANSINTAVCIRQTQIVPQGNITGASAVLQRLQLLQKYRTLNVLLKSGTLSTVTSAGVTSFVSLSDQIFQQTQIVADNKPVRNNFLNVANKEYAGYAFESVHPPGYLIFTFMDSMNPLTGYPADKLSGGSTFEIDSQVQTAGAQNFAEVIQEYFLGNPSAKQN